MIYSSSTLSLVNSLTNNSKCLTKNLPFKSNSHYGSKLDFCRFKMPVQYINEKYKLAE